MPSPSSSLPTPKTPLWLDLDTGHDDAFALLLATHHPSLHLLGTSTVHGNASLTHTTHNTLSILTALNRTNIPVYPGANKPFCRQTATAADIHGASGLDGTTLLPAPEMAARGDRTAVEACRAAMRACPRGEAWIVATGCLTNIALLFAVDPDLVHHIAGLSIMGGAVGGGFTDARMGTVHGEGEGLRVGNWTPWAEFNIYVDPEAASAVLGNEALAAKTTLVTLDVTHTFLATGEVQAGLLYGFDRESSSEDEGAPRPSTVRRLFVEILTFFAKTYADVFGLVEGPPVHDPLAVAALLPGLLRWGREERFQVEVVREGEHGTEEIARDGKSQCGRTVVTKLPSGVEGVRIPRGVDGKRVWRVLDECLRSAEMST